MSSFGYYAYGLGIRSTLPLPGYSSWEGRCDLHIRHERAWSEEKGPAAPAKWPGLHLDSVSPDQVTASVPGMAEVTVCHGSEIRLRLTSEVDLRFMQLMVCGPVISIALYQRGAVVLHASAVEVDGQAVLFCGESGWGKSSLAAALRTRGHRVLSDDVTALLDADGRIHVPTGSGQVKLNADVVSVLDLCGETLSPLHPECDKQAYREPQSTPERNVPLRWIYFLTPIAAAEGHAARALQAPQAVMELLRFSYGIHRLAPATDRERYFQCCAEIARSANCLRLVRRKQLASLPQLAAQIEADVRARMALS